MLMLALRLFLKDKGGGKQHCLMPFVGSNLGVETFLKKMEHQKRMRYNRGLRHLCILCVEVSRKFYEKPVCLLIVFWLYKEFLKLYFLSFLNYWISLICLTMAQIWGKDSLRVLWKCLVKSTLLPIGGKVPPTLRYLLWFP